jgi:hypothetical protein
MCRSFTNTGEKFRLALVDMQNCEPFRVLKPKDRHVVHLVCIPAWERDVPTTNYNYSVRRSEMQMSLLLLYMYGMTVFYYAVFFLTILMFSSNDVSIRKLRTLLESSLA